MRPLTETEAATVRPFTAWTVPSTEPHEYVVHRERPDGHAEVVWGPGGILVWWDYPGEEGWVWADDIEEAHLYIDEYRKMFPGEDDE